MIVAGITQAEAILWPVIGLFYLVALLGFLRVLIRGDMAPVRWGGVRFGLFLERKPNIDAIGGDLSPAEASTQVLGRRKS